MNVPTARALQSSWEGGVSPFSVSWKKLMMWFFIVTDALLFAGLLASYGFVRLASPIWPSSGKVFHLSFIAFMTFVLISSSATMATAVGAARRGELSRAVRWVLATIAGGLLFLGCQAYEWTVLIGEGARLSSNPWGVPLFSAAFFVITGFHGSHVATGILVLSVLAARAARGRSSSESVAIAGLYWHFVDLVWVFIFTLVYLV